MEQRSVEGMGFEEKGRRGRVERISWRFFFRRGSTIDPLNFSLLLAPPTPTAISHLSHSLSLSLFHFGFPFSLSRPFRRFSLPSRLWAVLYPIFLHPSLFSLSLSPFSLSRSYGIFIRRVIFRLWTECFRCYRRRESRWLIDSFALSFKRFCKLTFSHSMLPCMQYGTLIVVDIFLFDGTRTGWILVITSSMQERCKKNISPLLIIGKTELFS